MNIELSLILPAYNAAQVLQAELPGIIRFLKSQGVDYEIIVVDDGSKDQPLTRELCFANGCIFAGLSTNTGKGAALRKGFSLASGAIQVFTDCDLPFAYANLLEVYQTLGKGKADLVIGDRTHPSSKYYLEINPLRKWGSNLIAGIGSRLLQGHISDTQCGLKGFTRQSAARLFPVTQSNRFGIDFELLFLATKQRRSIHRIPVELRVSYPSTMRLLKDGPFTVWEIVRVIVIHGDRRMGG